MPETDQGITRRNLLKRGAVVGGTVLWATPVVQTLGMTRAFADTPSDTCIPSWATSVPAGGYVPGVRRDGSAVPPPRNDSSNALGGPDSTFVSLGFRGVLVVALGTPYFESKSGEALVIETTNQSYPLETAKVYVGPSAVGPWTYAGTAANTGDPALEVMLDSILSPGDVVTHVRIVDTSLEANFPLDEYPEADAFDVNAVGISCP